MSRKLWSALLPCSLLLPPSPGVPMASASPVPPPAIEAGREEREPPPEHITLEEMERRARGTVERVPRGTVLPGGAIGAATLGWTLLGPRPILNDYWAGNTSVSGRISSVAVDPTDGNIVYVAAAQGGVWKTTDGGNNWAPLTDGLSSLASGSVTLDPANHNVVYYGTGEQHYSGDSFYGDGLFRSTDAGASWTKIASASDVGSYISRVRVSPVNSAQVFVGGQHGFVRSTDSGATWTVTLGGYCDDMAVAPNGTDVFATILQYGVYTSTDAGATWTHLTSGLPFSGYYRVNLAMAPSNPNVLYASFVNSSGGLYGMYTTVNKGVTWTSLPSTPNYLLGQGWYDNAVAVHPANPNTVYAAGVYPYSSQNAGIIKSTDGGASWTNVTQGVDGSIVHPDMHYLAFAPNGDLWVSCDGGVWKTTDGGSHWINRNTNLGITQFYTVGVHPSDPGRLLGGTQDNGTVQYAGGLVWPQVIAGDGGPCLYEPFAPDTYYSTYINLTNMYRWNGSGYSGNASGPWQSIGDRADWANGGFVADPNTPNTLLVGTYRVWRSTDSGVSWAAISGDLTGGGVLRSLAVDPGNSSIVWSGSSDGRVYRTANGGGIWTLVSPVASGPPVTDLSLTPYNSEGAYVSLDQSYGARVLFTTDAGEGWMDLTGDLPPGLRVLSLVVDYRAAPERLYVGTDYGVYVSADLGGHWALSGSGLPAVATYDLGLDPVNSKLIAATHGRSMWRADLDVTSPAVLVTAPNGGEGWPYHTVRNIHWNASDLAGVDSVRVLLSTDGGANYASTIVSGIPNTGTYFWRVEGPQVGTCRVRVVAYDPSKNAGTDDSNANFAITGPLAVGDPAAEEIALRAVYPNPSPLPATIAYDLPRAGEVALEVFDPQGRLVRDLVRGAVPAGHREIRWDGRDAAGRPVGEGVYLYRLKVGSFIQSRRLVVVR